MWTFLSALTFMGEPSVADTLGSEHPDGWMDDPSPQLQGPLDAGAIRVGLDGVQPLVLRCFQAWHAQYPGQTATLEAHFVVSPEGAASDVTAADERSLAPWFQGCLTDALDGARYAPAAAPTVVSWTLQLDEAAFTWGGVGGSLNAPATPTDSRQAGETGETGGQWTSNGDARITGEPVILGPLDKSLIHAVIKQNLNQIRYCYQRELTGNPQLTGTITVKFVIARDGSVSQAETKTTTMNNPAVEGCLNKRFLKFQFPKPKGGGIVIVSYPFTFEPG